MCIVCIIRELLPIVSITICTGIFIEIVNIKNTLKKQNEKIEFNNLLINKKQNVEILDINKNNEI